MRFKHFFYGLRHESNLYLFYRNYHSVLSGLVAAEKALAETGFSEQLLNFYPLVKTDLQKQKAAGYFCFNYKNKILVYNSGFDPQFSEYSPGWVLLGYLLRWANENQIAEFDFMRGNEEYKYRFGAMDRLVICAIIDR